MLEFLSAYYSSSDDDSPKKKEDDDDVDEQSYILISSVGTASLLFVCFGLYMFKRYQQGKELDVDQTGLLGPPSITEEDHQLI